MYGIKQSTRDWYANMDSFLLSQKFERCKSYYNVYMQQKAGFLLLIVLYVDDFLITSGSAARLRGIKSSFE